MSNIETSPYLNDVLREMDQLPCSHPASVNLDVANTYYALAKMLRPLLIVEIGCFIGFSSLHFAQALKEQGFGKIISIDPFDWEVDTGEGMKNRFEVADLYRHKAGMENIIQYARGFSEAVHADIAAEIHNKIDLLYIDGDHSVEGVLKDFNIYYPDVRVGGHIILHDIYPEMCGVDGPRFLLDRLKQNGSTPRHLDILELSTRDGFGIAVLRKNSADTIHVTSEPPKPEGFGERLNKLFKPAETAWNDNRQRYYLSIKIHDKQSGEPIPNALFVCPQRCNEERRTDANGCIELDHYLPNRYQVDIFAEGYVPRHNFLIDVSPDSFQQSVSIFLEKQ